MYDADHLPRVHVVTLLGGVGAALGVLIIHFDSGATRISEEFVTEPVFYAWLLLIALQTAFFAIVIGPLLTSLAKLRRYFSCNKLEVSLAAALFALMFSVPAAIPRHHYLASADWPLAHHSEKIAIIASLAFIISLLAVLGILLVGVALRTDFNDEATIGAKLGAYLEFRHRLELYLWIMGAMIGLATLATGALRTAVVAVGTTSAETFPKLLVLAYGAYFTVLVALVFVPSYNTLIATGRRIVECSLPMPPPASDSWANAVSNRQKLEEYLRLRIGPHESLRTGIAILSPLLGGVISTLL